MDDIRLEMLKMWKSSWESSVKSLGMMQEQGEKMLEMLSTQSQTVQDETKNVINQAIKNAKEAQSSYFKTVEDIFKKIEETLAKK